MTTIDINQTDPRIARSRAKMLEAATDLLVEGGARAVTVDAVSERSGVAKSTLYRHFDSRTDLVVEVMRFNMPTPVEPPAGADFETTLRSIMQGLAASMGDERWSRIFPAMVSARLTIPEISELTEGDRTARVELLQQVLALGADEGVIGSLEARDVMPHLVGPLMFAVIEGTTERLPELADRVVDIFIAAHRLPS